MDEQMKVLESLSPGICEELGAGWWLLDAVRKLHEEMRPTFEDLIWKSTPTPEAMVAAQLTRFAVEQMRPIEVLDRAHEPEQAYAALRTAEENASNLSYILFAGPAVENRSVRDIAEQFLAYRHVEHARISRKWRAGYIEKYRSGRFVPPSGPKSEAEFNAHCDAIEAKAKAVRTKYPRMADGSWHSTNKEDRTKLVLKHLPAFGDSVRGLWASISNSTSLHNFQLHASPMLFEEDPLRLKRGRILELSDRSNLFAENWSVIAGQLALHCWFSLGDVFGMQPLVDDAYQRIRTSVTEEIVKRRRLPAVIRLA